jgi:hypothetical protein
MKNFLTALLVFTIGVSAFAASPEKVSATILSNFHSAFKEASNVSWLITSDYTKAIFDLAETKMEVYYNSEGDIIGTSKTIDLSELPVKVKRSFAKQFEGYNVNEAIFFDGFGEKAYYIAGENEKEAVILKVGENNKTSMFERTKK